MVVAPDSEMDSPWDTLLSILSSSYSSLASSELHFSGSSLVLDETRHFGVFLSSGFDRMFWVNHVLLPPTRGSNGMHHAGGNQYKNQFNTGQNILTVSAEW